MKPLFTGWLVACTVSIASITIAAPTGTIWNGSQLPELPLRYADATPIMRIKPQIANADKYPSESLYSALYPSINQLNTDLPTISPLPVSKTREVGPFQSRVNLSTSNVQEIEYIDMYEMNSRTVSLFNLTSNQVNLVLPRFGNAYRGSYQPLRFGFGPMGYLSW